MTNAYTAHLEDEFINAFGALFQTFKVTGPAGNYTVGRIASHNHSAWMVHNEAGDPIGKTNPLGDQLIEACIHHDPAREVA